MGKLTIRNLGPVRSVELELKPFMVVIGEQASGKSTLAKAAHFCLRIPEMIIMHVQECVIRNEPVGVEPFKKTMIAEFFSIFGRDVLQASTLLSYAHETNVLIKITTEQKSKRSLMVHFSESMMSCMEHITQCVRESTLSHVNARIEEKTYSYRSSPSLITQQVQNLSLWMNVYAQIKEVFGSQVQHRYIPAGRGLFSLLSNQFMSLETKLLDTISSRFILEVMLLRQDADTSPAEAYEDENSHLDSLRKKEKEILKGSYLYQNQKEYIQFSGKRKIPLEYASSGQQEVLWILRLLQKWGVGKQSNHVIIEEPEAHLYPTAQKLLVDYLALFHNLGQNHVFFTTHSPYMLTAMNNLIYAGRLGEKYPEKTNQIIPRETWLNPDEIGAYQMEKGSLREIIQHEQMEIQAEELDGVSKDINLSYGKLYALEVMDIDG